MDEGCYGLAHLFSWESLSPFLFAQTRPARARVVRPRATAVRDAPGVSIADPLPYMKWGFSYAAEWGSSPRNRDWGQPVRKRMHSLVKQGMGGWSYSRARARTAAESLSRSWHVR